MVRFGLGFNNEDGPDEPDNSDDNNGEISRVGQTNNDHDENSNDETDLESNEGTNTGVKETTTRPGRTISSNVQYHWLSPVDILLYHEKIRKIEEVILQPKRLC